MVPWVPALIMPCPQADVAEGSLMGFPGERGPAGLKGAKVSQGRQCDELRLWMVVGQVSSGDRWGLMASVFSLAQGEPGADGERGPKGDKVCGCKSPAADVAARRSKVLGRVTAGGTPAWVLSGPGGEQESLCLSYDPVSVLSPLQGDGGSRGDRGEPGEKGRDGAPVSTTVPPPCAGPRPQPGTNLCLLLQGLPGERGLAGPEGKPVSGDTVGGCRLGCGAGPAVPHQLLPTPKEYSRLAYLPSPPALTPQGSMGQAGLL